MIDDKFLVAAVNIKRKYIELVSNIDKYESKAKLTLEKLNSSLKTVEELLKDIKDPKKVKNLNSKDVLENMFNIVEDIENEGISLEKYVEPLNLEIEKLALEEEELYKIICEKHKNLTEEEIVNIVKERLQKENLY